MFLLDLFCGAGGAAVGYQRAGFDNIIGVDIEYNQYYPFEMYVGDAIEFTKRFGDRFDVIHASPPCQQFSSLNRLHKKEYPDYIETVRKLCTNFRKPYIIENVERSPLKNPIILCGTMFPPLRVIRHRAFESNIPLEAPEHISARNHPRIHTLDTRRPNYGKTDQWKDFLQVTGGGNATQAASQDAMGIDWMTKPHLNQAVPPAYTEYLGKQLLNYLEVLHKQKKEIYT